MALIDDTADQVEQVRYSSYGVPFGLPLGDTNSDATVDAGADVDNINSWWGEGGHPTGDTNLDGTIDSFDLNAVLANNGATLGWGVLSDFGNRKGCAGYELDDAIAGAYRLYHVRRRVLNSDLGRWTRRDPLFTTKFREILPGGGVESARLPARSPNLNAYAERFVLSNESECLDRMVLLGERHLGRAIGEYVEHYHLERAHRGLGNELIDGVPECPIGLVQRHERLGGLLNSSYREAA